MKKRSEYRSAVRLHRASTQIILQCISPKPAVLMRGACNRHRMRLPLDWLTQKQLTCGKQGVGYAPAQRNQHIQPEHYQRQRACFRLMVHVHIPFALMRIAQYAAHCAAQCANTPFCAPVVMWCLGCTGRTSRLQMNPTTSSTAIRCSVEA